MRNVIKRCNWHVSMHVNECVSNLLCLLSNYLSLLHRRGSVQSEVGVGMVVQEYLQHVQHACHLGENQNPTSERKTVKEKS